MIGTSCYLTGILILHYSFISQEFEKKINLDMKNLGKPGDFLRYFKKYQEEKFACLNFLRI
jgi:hypothetical protein